MGPACEEPSQLEGQAGPTPTHTNRGGPVEGSREERIFVSLTLKEARCLQADIETALDTLDSDTLLSTETLGGLMEKLGELLG